MAVRHPLRNQIIRAWHNTLSNAYPQQLINSERGLQVHFCRYLFDELEGLNRSVFIEPRFVDKAGVPRSPDVVICNSRSIIGIIELKYSPRVAPEFSKDLETLGWFSSEAPLVVLKNERYSGVDDQSIRKYELAPDAVLCWAGVYQGPKVDIESEARALGTRFHCMHAVTSAGSAPHIHPSLRE